ncbi:MAG TPA: ABC transporter ATP-binding protein [Acidimicrobiales bacterium]|nr:ABC transporter ATP-binding protein [Acidimicrobiales bacterium]
MVALSLLPAAVPPLMVELGRRLVDRVALSATVPTTGRSLLPLIVGLGSLAAFQRIAGAYIGTRQELFTRRVYLEAERRFLGHAATVDLGHFDNSDWHDRVARAKRDISWRPGQMTWAVMGMAGNTVTLLGMLGILLSLHPILVALVLLTVLPGILIQQRVNKRIYAFWWKETPEDRERDYLGDLLSAPRTAKELRSFSLGPALLERHATHGQNHYGRLSKLYRTYDHYNILLGLITGGALGLAYGFVAYRGVAGTLSVGALTAVIAAFASITQQLSLVTGSLVQLDQHATFLDDYFSFLAVPNLLPVPAEPTALPDQLDDGVRFEGVGFTYPGGTEPALAGLDLHVRAGELVALVGDNGAGKTSVVKLLQRFYDPDEGRVTIGGVDLREIHPLELRARIGVLFQDFANFELTARDNVTLGRVELPGDDDTIQRALDAARAADIVKKLPKGLDSHVGRLFEGGHDLSGGEWQRLALARLLYRNADIWVLDEPTAALDPEAEAAIFAELRDQLEGRIGLVISHRFSTVRIADRIAVIEDGRVSELGTHDELLAHRGRYAELFELQASGYR